MSTVRARATRAARVTLHRLPGPVERAVRAGVGRARAARRPSRTPLVSLVVPVYGVERYLPACLDSLLGQTHRHLQIILVDDGSVDRSIDIIRAYAARDPRIVVVQQANAGLGAARNAGAAVATGEYLMFIDSDDTLEPAAIRTFVQSLEKTGSDFAVASYRRLSAAGVNPAAWWIRRAHRIARPASSLQDFPEIQVNAVAWSKCYRRSFWTSHQFAFPVGVLYEDQAVSSRAYVLARSFDVLPQVLLNWRIRDDRSSITQQTAEVGDLRARLDAAYASLSELDRPGFERAREVRLAHYLSNDFPLSIKASQHGDDEFWSVLRDGLKQLTAQVTPYVWERVSAQHRIATALVLEDDRDEVTWFVGLGHNNPKNSPTVVRDGRVYTDIEVRHALGLEATDPFLSLGEHQLELVSSLRRAFWNPQGELVVEGWAYIDNLSLATVQPQIRAWAQELGGDRRVDLPVRTQRTPEVTAASRHRYADYENAGFALTVDPARLESGPAGRKVDWQVLLEVSVAGLTRSGLLARLDATGSAGRLTARSVPAGLVVPGFTRRDGLVLSLRPVAYAVDQLGFTDRTLTLTLTAPGGAEPLAVELTSRSAGQPVRASLRRSGAGRSETSVVVPQVGPGQVSPGQVRDQQPDMVTWAVQVVAADGTRSPVALVEQAGVDPRPTSSPYAAASPAGNLTVVDEPLAAWVREAEITPEGSLRISGRCLGVVADQLVFTVGTAKATAAARATSDEPGIFQATVPLRYHPWQLGERVLPVGSYAVRCHLGVADIAAESDPAVAVHLDPQLIDQLPIPVATETLRVQLKLVRPDGLQVVLDPPLADDERGARHQQRLQTSLAKRLHNPHFEPGAVLFRSYFGEIAGCNPLAVHRELRRRGTDHTLYWAVADHSVQVPEGGIPVVVESAEWYRLLHDAEFYMDNMHQPIYHAKPAHQTQIQTFHGYPFKQMGQSHWAWQGRDAVHVASYLDRARDWDFLVSPASYGTEPLVREFGFPNEVLEIGYPRNDVLLSADAPEISAVVRARLGVRPDQTALLYGPTFRDEMAQDDFKATMVDFLDIPRLAAELGDDYVVLVRGHAFNARVDARVGSRGNVVDVTDYPDIAELCLASDAAILDYSSLRFDYGLTGQPMLFMVPDLDAYHATSRGSILEFEPTAPGPLLKTTAEVIAAASELAQVRRDYAAAYATFRSTFLDLDDGHAAERLVDRVFLRDGR